METQTSEHITRDFQICEPEDFSLSAPSAEIANYQKYFEPIFNLVRRLCNELGITLVDARVYIGRLVVKGPCTSLDQLGSSIDAINAELLAQRKSKSRETINFCSDSIQVARAGQESLNTIFRDTSDIEDFLEHIRHCDSCKRLLHHMATGNKKGLMEKRSPLLLQLHHELFSSALTPTPSVETADPLKLTA